MMRASKVCRELNISLKKLVDLCEPYGGIESNPNFMIPESILREILPAYKVKASSPVAPETREEIILINLEDDIFLKRQPRIIRYETRKVSTIFLDKEAFAICYGLQNETANIVARKYLKNKNDMFNLVDIHLIAMKAKQKGGTKLMTFFVNLCPVPKTLNLKEISKILDRQSNSGAKPAVRILHQNATGEYEKIEFSYAKENKISKHKHNSDIIIVKNITKGNTMMSISKDGLIAHQEKIENINPIFQLFVNFSHNTKKFLIHYGLETRECSICFRTLETAESIKRGIGPVCYSKI